MNTSVTGANGVCEPSTDDNEKALWIVGLISCVLSSFGSTFGFVMQKISQNEQAELVKQGKGARVIAGMVMSKRWWTGMIVLFLFPFPFDLLSFTFAPQSLVTPMGGLS